MSPKNPEELLAQLRQQQFYMVTMQMLGTAEDPLPLLGPHLEAHLDWLIEQERNRPPSSGQARRRDRMGRGAVLRSFARNPAPLPRQLPRANRFISSASARTPSKDGS